MKERDAWETFRTFFGRGAAEVVCARLQLEGVPSRIVVSGAEGTGGFAVEVPGTLAHRARWILDQLPPTDEELEYLATGKLPAAD